MYVVYHVLYIGNWPKCLGILILLFLLASQQRICSLYSLILYCVTMDQKQHNIDSSKGAQLDHKVPIFALVLKYQSTVLRLRPLYIVDLSPYAKGDYFIQKSSQLFLKIGMYSTFSEYFQVEPVCLYEILNLGIPGGYV